MVFDTCMALRSIMFERSYFLLKATNFKLLVSRPGETMESMRVGGYYYYYLEYYYCTIQH